MQGFLENNILGDKFGYAHIEFEISQDAECHSGKLSLR